MASATTAQLFSKSCSNFSLFKSNFPIKLITLFNNRNKDKDEDHQNLYYEDKDGYHELRGYHIDGRDPDIIYLCPEYWDRKNQMILDPTLTGDDEHPIDKVPLEDVIFSKKNTEGEGTQYVLRRNNGKYELQFIQNTHPDLYALPCCGKKRVEYKVNSEVHVMIDRKWVKGKVKKEMNEDGYYEIEINGQISDHHVSRIDKYKPDKTKLSHSFPLVQGSNGHAHSLIKENFHMPPEFPILNSKTSYGFMRYGIQQDKDSFLNAMNAQINLASGIDRSLKELKEAIIHDMSHSKFKLSEVDQGKFIQYFRSESLSLHHKYSIDEMSEAYI